MRSTSLLLAIVGLLAVGPAVASSDGAPVSDTEIYTYTVHHSRHGNIGTYENIIARNGKETLVTNKVNIEVRILMVSVHDHVADRREVWRDGRIVKFEGTTRENGKDFHITGRAEGDRFVIDGPKGQIKAPGGVKPSNPWSKSILEATVLMGTKSGSLYHVYASEGEEQIVKVGDRDVQTTYFKIGGDKHYELWFDANGVPVRFTDLGDGREVITFELADGVQRADATTSEKTLAAR